MTGACTNPIYYQGLVKLCGNDILDFDVDFPTCLSFFRSQTLWCPILHMASNDLFSFLDNDNDSEISDSETALNVMQVDNVPSTGLVHASTPSNKRHAASETRINSPPPSPPIEDGPPSKKKRLDTASSSAPAVVVDEFETEAKREVPASAGLTGATETAGSRLELRYQARLIRHFLSC